MSEVRGRSQEDPMPEGWQPGGVTPRLRSGAVAERSYPTSKVGAEARRTPCPKGGGQEELPHVRGQGQQPRVPGCDGAGTAERSFPTSKVGAAAGSSHPTSKEWWLCGHRRA